MNPIFSRTLKAMCAVAAAALLSACGGASSTVDPLRPTRVIALGDDFNVASATVRVGVEDNSVAARLGALFGTSPTIVSCASVGAKVADLATQIASGSNCAGPYNEKTDLIVISIGMNDVKDSINATNFDTTALQLVDRVNDLLAAHAKHVLIMPALELSRTPWGRSNSTVKSTTDFNTAVRNAIQAAYGTSSTGVNPWIYANASNMEPNFLTATSNNTYLTFTDTGYDSVNPTGPGKKPACNPSSTTLATFLATASDVFAGCDAATANASYSAMLFADGLHLTPAGNLWIAQYLYLATSQGAWR